MKRIQKRPKCLENDCDTRPSFNLATEKTPLYCYEHKRENMVGVVSKKCLENDCKTHPVYNYSELTKGIYCFSHKKDNMIDIKSKICIHENCKKGPIYNFIGNKKRLYCSEHKLDGMVDVVHPVCIHIDCKIRPTYNYVGLKALYCVSHKLDNMEDVCSQKCISENCKIRPVYNFVGLKTRLYCASHKLDGMVDVASKSCKSEFCNTVPKNDKYDGYCLYCYIHVFPDKKVSRNYKTKEQSVVDFVLENYKNYSWVSDKRVQNGCSKRRPDLLLDLGYQLLIVEIDENQHIDYNCSCENKRTMELSNDAGHRPIVFIRFNPDDYMIQNKQETVKSCWVVNKLGLCVIKKDKKDEWNARLDSLKQQIDYWTNAENKTDKTVEIIQLFYDV